jgi:hypothetical protein
MTALAFSEGNPAQLYVKVDIPGGDQPDGTLI